jgi:hypothetical protein
LTAAKTLTRKAIELAKAGDLAALRVCLDRIAPPRKDRPVLFELPPVSSAADAAKAAAALLEAVAVGDLSAVRRWPKAKITVRQGARVVERNWRGPLAATILLPN